MRRVLALLSGVALSAVVGGCADDTDASRSHEGLHGDITVFAAASLSDAFGDVGEAFEDANPGVDVGFSFAGSSSLREQILDGAPADVFASANQSNMDAVADTGAVRDVETFATNGLQIVVPAGNPGGVDGLDAFGDGDLLIGLCAEQVPCGEFARQVLAAAGIEPAPDTTEPDVRALLTKVAADELDAGLVYVTDVIAEGDTVEGIDIPAEFDVVATYPIGTVAESDAPDVAAAFVAFVLGDDGQAILRDHGFGAP